MITLSKIACVSRSQVSSIDPLVIDNILRWLTAPSNLMDISLRDTKNRWAQRKRELFLLSIIAWLQINSFLEILLWFFLFLSTSYLPCLLLWIQTITKEFCVMRSIHLSLTKNELNSNSFVHIFLIKLSAAGVKFLHFHLPIF